MDFEASEEQRAVLEAVDALLLRHAGAARAIKLAATGAYDHELDEALVGSGFVDVGRSMSRLEAALVTEAVSSAAGRSAYAAAALVAPNVCDQAIDGPIAMADGTFADANFRMSMTAGVAVGATEIQLNLIASRILQLPKE